MQLPPDVTLVAFDVLMDFVDLYDFIKRDNKVIGYMYENLFGLECI